MPANNPNQPNQPTNPRIPLVVVRDCVVQSTPESTPLSGSPHIHTHSQWRSLVIPSTLSHATHHHPSAPSLSLSPFASLLPALSVSGTPSVLSLSLSLSLSFCRLPACLPALGGFIRACYSYSCLWEDIVTYMSEPPSASAAHWTCHTCRSGATGLSCVRGARRQGAKLQPLCMVPCVRTA
ncbi:hypothetical protein M758_9G003600 [Ceratodon purpureus]|nr:hypothetical protein M758_9G003600 [Ceratodon purpureus]